MPPTSVQDCLELATGKRCSDAFDFEEAPTSATSSTCSTTSSWSISRAASYAALSIYQLVQQNNREHLIIEPLLWTSRHIELLQCCFEEPSPAPSRKLSDITAERSGVGGVGNLFARHNYGWRDFVIRQILSGRGCPFTARLVLKFSRSLLLHSDSNSKAVTEKILPFASIKAVSPVPPRVVYFLQGTSGMAEGRIPAVAAYTDRTHMHHLRCQKLSPHHGSRYSKLTSTLFQLKLKKSLRHTLCRTPTLWHF
ncbi:hypothetical protein EMPG_10113 [Blastomyces silverae]|uniref:Uncharacterized protein n=1 Tax=Blastomyces silverae TaxID=2060906 RepID=A0A0H1BB91_9EURO|nr:hypothetical protein EMPG_10113 [Blastomyces silverae]